MLELQRIKQIVEAALLCADEPLTLDLLERLFAEDECDKPTLKSVIESIEEECAGRGIELKRVASGYRFQVRQELAPWMSRMWEDRPPRYSRAVLETLALIAYKQPVTRGDIEQVRGVAVNSNMVRALLERDWIRVVGYREVPGPSRDVRHHQDVPRLLQPEEPRRTADVAGNQGADRTDRSGTRRCRVRNIVEGPRVEFPSDEA